MTRGIRRRIALLAFYIAGIIGFSEAQYSFTREFTSNDILGIDGNGRALAMITSKGFNYTADITQGKIEWQGFLGIQPISLAIGSGNALVCLQPKTEYSNDLFIYTFPGTFQQVQLQYNSGLFVDSFGTDIPFFFWGYDAEWFNGSFWIACLDGGLVQVTPPSNTTAIYYPGRDNISYTFETFLPDSFPLFPDTSSARAMAVDADSSLIWLACAQALWSFDPSDTTWTKINDSALGLEEYYDIKVRARNDSTSIVYAIFTKKNGARADTCLYTYNTQTDRWHNFISTADLSLQTYALGEKDYVYILDRRENEIRLYRDTVPDSTLAMDTPYGELVLLQGEKADFQGRITKPGEIGISDINLSDINYATYGSDTLFQIATDKGLLYSNNEHYDEEKNIPFSFEYRSVTLSDDLEKTYAVPGIMNNYHPETVFAYNIKDDDFVTIDIFDYNMDHVVRIIDKAWRQAGKNRTNGRSTVPRYDRWNGRVDNGSGRIVPPGVYFYRIKTEKGKRAFGKVIVAKN